MNKWSVELFLKLKLACKSFCVMSKFTEEHHTSIQITLVNFGWRWWCNLLQWTCHGVVRWYKCWMKLEGTFGTLTAQYHDVPHTSQIYMSTLCTLHIDWRQMQALYSVCVLYYVFNEHTWGDLVQTFFFFKFGTILQMTDGCLLNLGELHYVHGLHDQFSAAV